MLSTWYECLEVSRDSVSESHWDDAVPAGDDETSETWTQPWDMPAVMNYADHSNTSDSHGGLHDMSAADSASKNIPTEYLNAKGTVLCCVFMYKIVILAFSENVCIFCICMSNLLSILCLFV